jgi:hypothetical protein
MLMSPQVQGSVHFSFPARRSRRAEAAQLLPPERQDDAEVLRLALALHAYNALKAAQAAAGGAAPASPPVLVSAAAPPAAPAPVAAAVAVGGGEGLAPVRVPAGLPQGGKVR